jgi:FkbM family methyltransferase
MSVTALRRRVRNYVAQKLSVPEIPVGLKRLNANGFKPRHIFDVGAYQGDFARLCLSIWPDAQIVCFEPLNQRVEQLEAMASLSPSIRVIPGLLGANCQDQVPLHEMETATSVLEEHFEQQANLSFHQMRTVDYCVEHDCPSPDFLKLDVQGYELEVLKGAEKTLGAIKVILAEVNFLDIHRRVPLLFEMIDWLNERDWLAYDICGLTRRPLDGALWQSDMIFVPRDSPLRSDKRWQSAPLTEVAYQR